ncbi:MAG: heat-shock protein Hsp20 [Bacilli bacterium]|nr:heat-shock protein Hsp20 [Bacilli bacterium]
MNLTPYNPFNQLDSFRHDVDQFFQNGLGSIFTQSETGIGFPKIDIHETDHDVVASCNLPGIEKKEDINIDISNNVLTISGSIQRSNDIKEDQFHQKERYFGRFDRSVRLNTQVSNENVQASYKNGVLEVRLPKQKEETRKQINIEFK